MGLKIIRDLVQIKAPWNQFNSVVQWFCSALRRNTNQITHYLDDTVGQGILLETISRKYFFDILKVFVSRLKTECGKATQNMSLYQISDKLKLDKDIRKKLEQQEAGQNKRIKILVDALKWKFTGRDHAHLSKLGSHEDERSSMASPVITELKKIPSGKDQASETPPNFF
jgi:hypothetical protein